MLTPRHELVIGVNDYTALDPLKNPRNDASKVYAALKRMGFNGAAPLVDVETDGGSDTTLTTRKSIYLALGDLSRAARNDGGVIFLYFAGHGLTYQNETYLLPSDTTITEPSDIKLFGIPMSDIFNKIKEANATAAAVIVDACRNNPFGQQAMPSEFSLVPVLSQDPPTKTLAMFSTVRGDTADDGEGGNSPFTTSLLAFMEEPDRPIEMMLNQVRQTYLELDKAPILNSRILGEFVLMSTKHEFQTQSVKWAQASQVNTSVEYDGFIKNFPGGYFERAARQKLNQTAQNEAIAATRRATAPVMASNRAALNGAVLFSNPFVKSGQHAALAVGEPLSVVGKSGIYLLVVRDRDGTNGYVLEQMTQLIRSDNVSVAFDPGTAASLADASSTVRDFLTARNISNNGAALITVQSVLPNTAPASSAVAAHDAAANIVKQLTDAGVPRNKIQIAPVFKGGDAASIQIIGATSR